MTQRTDPEKHKEQVRAANRARHRATKRLVANHRDEFDALYAHEAEKEGVSPKPREAVSVVDLRSQIQELTSRVARITGSKAGGQGTRR